MLWIKKWNVLVYDTNAWPFYDIEEAKSSRKTIGKSHPQYKWKLNIGEYTLVWWEYYLYTNEKVVYPFQEWEKVYTEKQIQKKINDFELMELEPIE